MARHKDAQWDLCSPQVDSWAEVQVAVLMDIRDELKQLNRLLGCQNFIAVPQILRRISSNTAKPKKNGRTDASH